jgi:hypothetical protein
MYQETAQSAADRIAGVPDPAAANRAVIERAQEIQAAKLAAREHANGTDQAVENYRKARGPQIPSPYETLKSNLAEALGRWDRTPVTLQTFNGGRPAAQLARFRAVAGLALLDEALLALGDRAGDRAAACREALTAQRDTIASAIAHYDSLANLEGPAAVELTNRIVALRAASDAAHHAREHATRESIQSALLEIERVAADARQLDRDIAAALSGLAVPALPNEQDFRDARASSEDLELRQPGKRPRAELVARAIEAGLRTPINVARLFICFETPGGDQSHELIKWRAKALSERA